MASGSQDESDIERQAREEILRDVKKAKARTETLGSVGWRPCPLPKANKRFLHNTLMGTLQANRAEAKRKRHKEAGTHEPKLAKRSKDYIKEHKEYSHHDHTSASRSNANEMSKQHKQENKIKSKRKKRKV